MDDWLEQLTLLALRQESDGNRRQKQFIETEKRHSLRDKTIETWYGLSDVLDRWKETGHSQELLASISLIADSLRQSHNLELVSRLADEIDPSVYRINQSTNSDSEQVFNEPDMREAIACKMFLQWLKDFLADPEGFEGRLHQVKNRPLLYGANYAMYVINAETWPTSCRVCTRILPVRLADSALCSKCSNRSGCLAMVWQYARSIDSEKTIEQRLFSKYRSDWRRLQALLVLWADRAITDLPELRSLWHVWRCPDAKSLSDQQRLEAFKCYWANMNINLPSHYHEFYRNTYSGVFGWDWLKLGDAANIVQQWIDDFDYIYTLGKACNISTLSLGDAGSYSIRDSIKTANAKILKAVRDLKICKSNVQRWDAATELVTYLAGESGESVSTVESWSVDEAMEFLSSGRIQPVPTQSVTITGVEQLTGSHRNAWFAFLYAAQKLERTPEGLPDKEAWDYLKQHGIEGAGDLDDYKLPKFATFTDYLTKARNGLGEQKKRPRTRRGGRSTPNQSEI